jgi:hypothetical protein
VINLKTAKATPLAVLARADAEMPAIGPKQTCRKTQPMSLLGVKRTWVAALHMSAFDPKQTSDADAMRSNYRLFTRDLFPFGAIQISKSSCQDARDWMDSTCPERATT